MSIFDRFKRSRKEPVSDTDLANYLQGDASWTGLDITRSSVMGIGAVWAAVRVLSETFASLPLPLYRRLEKGKEKATEHPLFDILFIRPNSEQSAFMYKETAMGHLALQGNHYGNIVRNGTGYIRDIWPLNPEKMTKIERVNGKLIYHYDNGGKIEKMPQEQVFHVPGLSYDGIRGYSPIELLKQEFGIPMAGKRYGAEFFKNSGAPSGYISVDHSLNDEGIKRLKDGWGKRHTDWGSKASVAVLEQGTEWKSVTIPPDDAQFIETLKLSTTEIARIFRIPPHMIADLEHATFSNIEHQGIEFVTHTMRPWLVRWEQAVSLQLISDRDRDDYFAEFLIDALLRGDITARSAAYRTFREIGVYSANEIRAMENKNPVEGGDKYYVPMNWIPADADVLEVDEPEEDERSLPAPREIRARRSAAIRYNLAKSFEDLFADAVGKIIRKETNDLKRGIDKHLRTLEDFDLFIEKYYEDMPEYIRKVITPTYSTFLKAIKNEIASELDVAPDVAPEDLELLGAYITTFARRYINKSKKDIHDAIEKGTDNGIGPDVMVTDLFDKWEEDRPQQVALNESVRSSNAFAKNIYLLVGVIRLIWVSGGPSSCPFCSAMDGQVVGIEQDFAMASDELVAQGQSLNVQHSCGHPPLHRGCVCQISAGF